MPHPQRLAAAGPGPAAPRGSGASVRERLSELYSQAQDSPYVFASPLGPFRCGEDLVELPRLAFFGPAACDDSWRLAFLAGFDHRDRRSSRALLALVSGLSDQADSGHGLNLSFFPVVDAAGLLVGAPDRNLGTVHWGRGAPPEISLLELDARINGYHGFVRIETSHAGEDVVVVRLRRPEVAALSPDQELITTEETELLPVRFETIAAGPVADGPLSIADDLPLPPFEITLQVPAAWPEHAYQRSAVVLLKRFLRRYRAFQAYGQHL